MKNNDSVSKGYNQLVRNRTCKIGLWKNKQIEGE